MNAKQVRLGWSPQRGVNHVSAYIHEDCEINRYQWQLLERILDRFNDDVKAIGAELIVMLLPVTFRPQDLQFVAGAQLQLEFMTPDGAFTFRAAEPRDRLQRITDRLRIRFSDPSTDFIAYVREKKIVSLVWPDAHDRHFSDVGHEILADLSDDYLTDLITQRDSRN